MHDPGISREGDLINVALDDKLIDKSGACLNYGEVRLGQGKENAKQYLRENPALVDEISPKILEKRGLPMLPMSGETANGRISEPAAPPKPQAPARKRQAAIPSDG